MIDNGFEMDTVETTRQNILLWTLKLFQDYKFKLYAEGAIDRDETYYSRTSNSINTYYGYTPNGLSIPKPIRQIGKLGLFMSARLYASTNRELSLRAQVIDTSLLEDLTNNRSVEVATKVRLNEGKDIKIPLYGMAELDLAVAKGLQLAMYDKKPAQK